MEPPTGNSDSSSRSSKKNGSVVDGTITRANEVDSRGSLNSIKSHGGGRARKLARYISSGLDRSGRPTRVCFYAPPQQRQKWGETQCLPRVNWGDLFFDLFFVAATYQVTHILGEDPSLLGVLFAAGTFLPVMGFWLEKMWYDARYVHDDDLVHRILELATLVVLGTAVLHIRSVSILSDVSGQVSMFAFAMALVLEKVLSAIRYAEVYWLGVGHHEGMRGSVRLMIVPRIAMFACYIAAATIAGIAYFGSDSTSLAHRRLADATTTPSPSLAPEYANGAAEEASTTHSTSYVPIWLCFAGYVSSVVAMTIQIQFCFPKDGRHKDRTVPMNIDFTIHRNGEWIMLMLGESIFSLLIVEVPEDSNDYYTTFFCGVLTIVLLQYLHFKSQPHHAHEHALRRNKDAGIWWNNLQHVYSFFLVCLGADYTFFLSDFSHEFSRRLDERSLAGATESSLYDPEEVRSRAAKLYGASLAIIFACLDAMTLLHLGLKESQGRCVCEKTKKKNVRGILLIVVRVGVIAFTATLGLWLTDPTNVSILGVVCVLIQILFRKLGGKYLTHETVRTLDPDHKSENSDDDGDDVDDDASWPNVTHARAHHEPTAASAAVN